MKVVQDLLRHSSITVTSDLYTSVLPDLALDAAEKAAARVPRKRHLKPFLSANGRQWAGLCPGSTALLANRPRAIRR